MFVTVMFCIGLFVTSLLLTAIFMIFYFKGVHSFGDWIISLIRRRKSFPDVSNKSGKARQDSKIEICCIYCFEKYYHFFKSNVRRLHKLLHRFIGVRNVSKDTGNQNSKSEYKNFTTNIKSRFHNHVLILAGIAGALLACGFIYFLYTRFEIFNPTILQRLLLIIIGAACAGISFISFLKLSKSRNRKYATDNSYQKQKNGLCGVSVNQPHKPKDKTYNGNNSGKYTQKHPASLAKEITHIFLSKLAIIGKRIIGILKGIVNHNGKEPRKGSFCIWLFFFTSPLAPLRPEPLKIVEKHLRPERGETWRGGSAPYFKLFPPQTII